MNLLDSHPQLQLANTTVTQIGSSSVIEVAGLPVTGAGSLLQATDSMLAAEGNALLVAEGGSLMSTAAAPFIQLSGSTLTAGKDFLQVFNLGQLITGGSLLKVADGSTVTTTNGAYISALSGGLVLIPGAGVDFGAGSNAVHINNATAPTKTINGVPVSIANDAFISIGPNSGLDKLTVKSGGSAIVASGVGTLVTIAPLLLPAGPVLTITADKDLGADPLATFGIGPSASIVIGPPLKVTAVKDQGIAQLTGSVINITHSIATSQTNLIDLSGTSLAIPGPLLQMQESSLINTHGRGDLLFVDAGSLLKTFGTAPLMQFDLSQAQIADFFTEVAGILALSAPLLDATNSTFTSKADFVRVSGGGTLTSTSTRPLVQLIGSPVTAFTFLFVDGGTVNLAGGPLLSAIDSNLTVDFALVDIEFQGQVKSTSTEPLVTLSAADRHQSGGHLFLLGGSAIDPTTGLGTDKPLQTGGALFKATDAASMKIAGNALRLDTALLEASAPIISLVGSATKETSLTTGRSTMDLFRSQVTSTGPVVALDKGIINVSSGPLINLTKGSNWTVNGDLLSLLNGSKINVVNGPLIRVDGVAPTGTGPAKSTLDVSGALANFGGTGGNQIIVNNNLTVTDTKSGIKVHEFSGGTIAIGPNPIKNLGTLGTLTQNGAVIQATNSGKVNIKAP